MVIVRSDKIFGDDVMRATGLSNRLRGALALTVTLSIFSSACSGPDANADGEAQAPIAIERMGSFMAGGELIGEPDNSLFCGHGFVDYQIPVDAKETALFMWHSSSAAVWQNRWDGGEGYQSIFLRRGFPVYIWDGPRVGRANWGCEEYGFKPRLGQTQRSYVSWRFGPAEGEWFPGVQFPKDDPEALEQAMRARYQEFDIPKNVHLEAEAAAKAIDRAGPAVLVTNSAGGLRAMLAATKSDNVKGIVAYETPGYVFPEGEGPEDPTGPINSAWVPMDEFMALTRIPIQIVWGDNTEKTYWAKDVLLSQKFVDVVNAHGGNAEVLMLPDAGLVGNTHIAFADLNNVEVADLLSLFLKKNNLDGAGAKD